MKSKQIFTGIGIIILLALIWYTVSPLFIDKVVSEKSPISNEAQISASYSGTFSDADRFHKVSGDAKVFSQNGKNYLRFENFEATNGPDLYVYLSTAKNNDDYVSLGKLKGNIGDQNYELPENVDLKKYNNVLIWCQRFSVLFGSAEIEKI